MPASATVDERGQLAQCLAFISDMALTGDTADPGPHHQASIASVLPGTSSPQRDDEMAEGGGDQEDDEVVPEPLTDSGSGGRARWLRHRLARLRLQRQRSAPSGATGAAAAAFSASVDDSVSSHIQMLNSLDSQVRATSNVS